ncbi:ADP-ribosylation factor GTPase-activating protein AGD4-like [Chenopodium quinoa]|uniref:ADP-ribosylation factor GTPase-activating protein AGD4-like n=1 Tax=Chenopodium quinoa TaxID=63459 RepID=UPI000B76EAB4|nr:ADP-ribosylation factor GTPase-activating protein AGD4-like [Chenopodium quinoa]
MASYIDLEDSPMFHKQVFSMEQTTDELKDRCQKLYKGSQKLLAALSEAYEGDTSFADALESFGGQDDPLSLSIGGPLISKFTSAFRELATYKDLLRLQVEHVLVDRLQQFVSADLQDAKDARRRFDKSIYAYDQARERYASLKKSTREDIVAGLEEDLHNSKSAFERTRFSLVNSLMNVESKKKYEFLESFSAIMDAHLKYFKLGYELLSQMEPLIHQVLTYAQQSKEVANAEQDKLARRMQEFRTQVQLDNLRVTSNTEASTSVDSTRPTRPVGMGSSCKDIEAIMQSTTNGMVQTIKQGYLLKRSSSLRANWKRRFFVLDSRGTLYYHRTKGPKPVGSHSNQSTSVGEQNNSVFGRFRSKHNRTPSWTEDNLGCRTVDLRTSTIKIDAEDRDLRLCFRVISPSKTYTLQAETEADRMEWVNKITGVITSLLNSHLEQEPFVPVVENHNSCIASEAMSTPISHIRNVSNDTDKLTVGVSQLLQQIPGNNQCAECSAPEPDWASLNLGILMCIECSGAHRNLGVHISKVRSITLDVKVWEPTVLELFQALGNAYCNSVWEEQLSVDRRKEESDSSVTSIVKPSSNDSFSKKEKYVQMKYAEKQLISLNATDSVLGSRASALWEAVRTSNLREAYRLIAVSDTSVLNTTYDEIHCADLSRLEEELGKDGHKLDPATCPRLRGGEPEKCLRGCSLLHLACHVGNTVMVELLLQSGADVNMRDFHGRTPLHHCIARKNDELAKYLLRRGARRLIKDWGGLTALERAMELGSITDDVLFILLSENE